MVEIACLIVVGVVGYMVAQEGVWGAAQTFLCTLLAGLLAMNFFEMLAPKLGAFLPLKYCDFVALVGLFTGLVFGIRLGTEQLAQRYIQVIPMVDTVGRYVAGAATGYLTMAILLTSLHTAPLPREFMGFKPEKANFFTLAPDRQWLGFTQYVSEKPLARLVSASVKGKPMILSQAFDGEIRIVGDPANPYSIRNSSGVEQPLVVWPSFPIRYAMRREQFGSGQSGAVASQPVQVIPPSSGGAGGSSSGGF